MSDEMDCPFCAGKGCLDAVSYFERGDRSEELFSQQENLRRRVERAQLVTDARGPLRERLPLPVYTDSANQQDIAELNWHFAETKAKLAAVSLPARKDIDAQTSRVQAMLEPLEDHPFPRPPDAPPVPVADRVYGAPRLFFFDSLLSTWDYDGVAMRCSRLLWEAARWQWGKDNRPDNKSADGADGMAALRYGTAIMHHTAVKHDPNAWKRRLSPEDALMWSIIERDRQRRGQRRLLAREG